MFTRIALGFSMVALLTIVLFSAVADASIAAEDYFLTTADGLTLALSSAGQVTSLQIDGAELVSTPGSALLLRDLSEAGQVAEPNLLTNPGFEEGLTGWTEITNYGLSVNLVGSPTHSGDQALSFFTPVTDSQPFAAYASDPLAVTAGQRYRVSAWWRSARGYVTQPSVPATQWQMGLWREPPPANGLYVQWLDNDSTPLGTPQLAVPLHWNAVHWRLIRRELTAPAGAAFARLIIGARVGHDTLWVDDAAFVPAPEQEVAVAGKVVPCSSAPAVPNASTDACLLQTAVLSNGLTISITYTAYADHIAIEGEVRDATGQDRALDISWGVPMVAEGGVWWDDAQTPRPITDTRLYANAISAIYDGWLPVSLYPYAGLATAPGQKGSGIAKLNGEGVDNPQSLGLALALPLDRPQLVLLAYDGAAGRYNATYHLGISPQAVKVGPRATFALMLYRFDPAWGFRDVVARHRLLQPEAYSTDLPVYDYQGRSQGQYYSAAGAYQVKADDAANVYSAQYTVGEFHVRVNPDTEPRPGVEQVMQAVTDTLQSSNARAQANAQALLASVVRDTNGDWSVKKLGSFPWSQGYWEMIWAGNVDPDLADGLGQYMVNWLIDPAFAATEAIGAHLEGVQIDNFQAVPTFDLRPEALAAADTSLAYTPHTYQPAVHTGFAFYEYLAFLRQHLDATWGADRGITINFWGLGNPNYLAPYLDGFGSEGKLKGNGQGPNWSPEILNYRRAIAFSRPYLFANQMTGLTAGEAYTFSQMALLYGVVAGPGPNSGAWEPEAMQIISDTAALVGRYWAAGWEPLTFARASSEDVWIERFGDFASAPPALPHARQTSGRRRVFFAIHNHTDLARTASITIETAPLGLADPAFATLTDIAITQTLPFTLAAGNIHFNLKLGPGQTRVIQLDASVPPETPTPTPPPRFFYLPMVLSNPRDHLLAFPATPTTRPENRTRRAADER